MSRRLIRLSAWGLIAALSLAPALAIAGKKADAQKHFQTGKSLMKTEDFKGAMVEFETSVELYPTKNGLFNLGNCYKALHRYGEALDVFRRLEREFGSRLGAEMRSAVARNTKEIESLIAELVVEAEPAGAIVTVDGRDIGAGPLDGPLVLGPGEHELEVTLEGYGSIERKLRIVSGVRQVERVKLEPVEESPVALPPAVGEPGAAGEAEAESGPPEPVAGDDGGAPGPDAAAPSEAVDPAPEELVEDESPLSAVFWVGVVGTVACGATAGVFWGLASKDFEKFDKERDEYLGLSDAQQAQEYDRVDQLGDNVRVKRGMAIGFTAGAGLFLIGTVIALGVDLSGDETDTVEVAATPGGVALSF